ncbi:hypothetical protein Mapa_006031 [Marchantia paleacea]|nr:hypothetical protein Mapa_006031 [Marchantia paleacea]
MCASTRQEGYPSLTWMVRLCAPTEHHLEKEIAKPTPWRTRREKRNPGETNANLATRRMIPRQQEPHESGSATKSSYSRGSAMTVRDSLSHCGDLRPPGAPSRRSGKPAQLGFDSSQVKLPLPFFFCGTKTKIIETIQNKF